jgi:hypothetical protein
MSYVLRDLAKVFVERPYGKNCIERSLPGVKNQLPLARKLKYTPDNLGTKERASSRPEGTYRCPSCVFCWSTITNPSGKGFQTFSPPAQALLVPITSPVQENPAGVLIVALNPYRQLDAGYRGFIDLEAGQIAATLPATALPKTNARLQAVEARG